MNEPHHLDCETVRLRVGAEPQVLPDDIAAHIQSCPACHTYRDETLMLDGRIRAALEEPLVAGRVVKQTRWPRLALAASVTFALVATGAFWTLRPAPALAGVQVIEHVEHEEASWSKQEQVTADELAAALKGSGVEIDPALRVVYASLCPFRGRDVPHLVVSTADGPATVMLLTHENVTSTQGFAEQGFVGVIVPSRFGAVAVLSRGTPNPVMAARQIVSQLRAAR